MMKKVAIIFTVGVLLLCGLGYYFFLNSTSPTQDYASINSFQMDDVHGLYGGYDVTIHGDGDVSIVKMDPVQGKETKHVQVSKEDVEHFRSLFKDNHFLNERDIATKGIPDESVVTITIKDGFGRKILRVSQSYNEQTKNFTLIHQEFIDFATKYLN
jgi:hypothetical protein